MALEEGLVFPERVLNNIRDRINLVDLAGEYVVLKKSGQSYSGLCPFHNEKTPSFHVHAAKQCFHCFGCHKGGNLFTFLCAIEGVSFPEAVRKLAKQSGVELTEEYSQRKREPKIETTNDCLLSALEWAAKYFHHLLTQVKEYRPAFKYVKSRGISDKTIEKFQIGVSPMGWNTLLTLMTKRKYSLDELIRAGLVIGKEGGQGYDRFRYRLMFPIRNLDGNVIGFGARILAPEENQPKYINSPESPIFSKRKLFYGLFENQRHIRLRGEGVIVEGYMDVVGLYDRGVTNAIATMGTALTEEHCDQIIRFSRRVVTVFDPDLAGCEAWHRSVHMFLAKGILAKDLRLPGGRDPDEFIIEVGEAGASEFYSLCEKAPRHTTKLLREIAARGPLSDSERSQTLAELTPVLLATRQLPERALLWDQVSLVLNVSLATLKNLVESQSTAHASRHGPNAISPKSSSQRSNTSSARSLSSSSQTPKYVIRKLDPLDLEFFKVAVKNPKLFLAQNQSLWVETLREPLIQRWLGELHQARTEEAFEACLEEIVQKETNPVLLSSLTPLLLRQTDDGAESGAAFKTTLTHLQSRKKEQEIKVLAKQLKLGLGAGDDAEQLRLLEKLGRLRSLA